jgi:hypothetical protein
MQCSLTKWRLDQLQQMNRALLPLQTSLADHLVGLSCEGSLPRRSQCQIAIVRNLYLKDLVTRNYLDFVELPYHWRFQSQVSELWGTSLDSANAWYSMVWRTGFRK